MFPGRIALAIFRMLDGRNIHYTAKSTMHCQSKIIHEILRPVMMGNLSYHLDTKVSHFGERDIRP